MSVDSLRQIRIEKLEKLRSQGINPYPYHFEPSHKAAELHSLYALLPNETVTEDQVTVAGRVMAIRNSGLFIVIDDTTERLQLFCQKILNGFQIVDSKMRIEDPQCTHVHEESEIPIFSKTQNLKDEGYVPFDLGLLDIGDWIGATGIIRRTKRGELTVNVQTLSLLTKTLLTLPEKYHGLVDIETRYRQRYLDLIMNPESRNRLRKRSQILLEIRTYLGQHGFLEVETPMLQTLAGGAAAKPFSTYHNALNLPMVLRIAPELFLKRLMVGGLSDRLFEINRCFRNEGLSPRHNPEFTSLELYQAYADYHDMMTLAENLMAEVALSVAGSYTIAYQGKILDLTPPWPRRSMIDLVKDATGTDFSSCKTAEAAYAAAKALGIHVDQGASWGRIVEVVFGEKVEHTLVQPIHVIDFPHDISPLAKEHRDDPHLTERFESYINAWEVANAFSELTDPIDQRNRFEAQLQAKEAGDEEAHPMDEDFITALEYGLPPTGGLGIGIDRFVMILTDAPSIRDVIAFPAMKPIS